MSNSTYHKPSLHDLPRALLLFWVVSVDGSVAGKERTPAPAQCAPRVSGRRSLASDGLSAPLSFTTKTALPVLRLSLGHYPCFSVFLE